MEADIPDDGADRTVRLKSTSFCHVPGTLAWAKAGYQAELCCFGAVGPFIGVFADGYRLGAVLAERVLRGDIVSVVDGDTVILKLSEDEYRLYRSSNPKPKSDTGDNASVKQPDLAAAN